MKNHDVLKKISYVQQVFSATEMIPPFRSVRGTLTLREATTYSIDASIATEFRSKALEVFVFYVEGRDEWDNLAEKDLEDLPELVTRARQWRLMRISEEWGMQHLQTFEAVHEYSFPPL